MTVCATKIESDEKSLPSCEVDIQSSESVTFRLEIKGLIKTQQIASCTMMISLPQFTKEGYFNINGIQKTICNKAIVDYSTILTDQQSTYSFNGKLDVIIEMINDCLHRSLNEFFYTGAKPVMSAPQHLIDTWLKTSQMCQVVPESEVAKSSMHELVYLSDAIGGGLNLEKRMFSDQYLGLLDLASTSSSKNINMVYRLVKGIGINKGKLVNLKKNKDTFFCTAVEDNVIGAQYNPKRVHMLRTQFEQSLQMVNPDELLVRSRRATIQGVHLNTAIMELGDKTYEDAIAISESAAVKLKCIRNYKISVSTRGDIKVLVKEGDAVSCHTKLIECINSQGIKTVSKCSKLDGPGTVTSVVAIPTVTYGIDMMRFVVKIKAHYNCKLGDKLTTRGAIKGVATIVPDIDMPTTEDGDKIECCMSPSSIYNRQSMVTLWEMMANKLAISTRQPVESRPYDEEVSFKELVEAGFGDNEQLLLHGQELPEKTYIGPLLILRLDKLASETVSHQDGEFHLNQQGLPVDQAKISGQRCDLSTRMGMSCKGLDRTLEHITKDGIGQNIVTNIVEILRNDNDAFSSVQTRFSHDAKEVH